MRRSLAQRSIFRSARVEPLEPRAMMSASPPNLQTLGDADFVLDYFTDVAPAVQQPISQPISRFSFSSSPAPQAQFSLAPQSLANAHIQTGLAAARAAYGLTGRGQTVAVIDTG